MQLRDYQQALVAQTSLAWRQGFHSPCIVLPCGGGKSVITADMAKRATDHGKRVLFLAHRKELCDQIQNTFRDYGVNMELCAVGMVQTVCRRLSKIPTPNLIITDENHHCPAASYRKIYTYFPNAYCVGVTATPVRLNGGGLGDVNDTLLIGPTVRRLIERHCLADFDYYAPTAADLSGLHSKRGDYAAEEAARLLDTDTVYGDVIRYYRRLADGKQAICYCPTIAYSQKTARQFQANGIPSAHLDGATPKAERDRIIQAFRSGTVRILCNVDLISEGFDVPDCSASILLRPTKSLTLYLQQAMRCMRYKPGKRAVILDHVGNVHRFGLPDQDRVWTLDPKPQKNVCAVPVRQCTRCFYTHKPAPVCPKCGYAYPISHPAPTKEQKAAELEKITHTVSEYASPEQCRNGKELHAYAKMKGYKPGWVYYQMKRRDKQHD